MSEQLRTCGPLQAIEFCENHDGKWIVLFHGFGADASDLASLKDHFQFDKPSNWLFPNGQHSVDIGGGYTGRAWWKIKMTELQPGMDWTNLRPDGMDQAVALVFKMMASMKFQWKDLILGGFSQGAMLATEIFLKAPETPAGLICMSGTLLSESLWSGWAQARKGSTIFMSHGEADQVLPHKGSIALQKFFEKNEIKTQFASFRGGHEIPLVVLNKMTSYIKERL
ncbi:MAG: serine esterase [Bdellovibrio sp.]|nr:serine esterase [Bdellovibrio sp.]